MPPIDTALDPMDVQGIWRQGITQLWAMAERQTSNMVAWYKRLYEAWAIVYVLKGYDLDKTIAQAGPMPTPPKAYTLANTEPKFLEYPPVVLSSEPACDPLPLPTPPNYDPVAGTTIFGQLMWGWPKEAYQASDPSGLSAGPVGRKSEHDGKTFVLREKGAGSVFRLLYWEIAE